jgi:dynein heavy chain 1
MTTNFRTWDDLIKGFTDVAREVTGKRLERFIPDQGPTDSNPHTRTRYLRDWKKQYEKLAVMTDPTKGLGGVGIGEIGMEEGLKDAYKRIDRLGCESRRSSFAACNS